MTNQELKAFAAKTIFSPQDLAELREHSKIESRRECQPQVDALILAGWRFELPEIVNHNPPVHDWSHSESEPWQWYWRRPPRRKTGKGRKYWSTNQAFMALKRESNNVTQ